MPELDAGIGYVPFWTDSVPKRKNDPGFGTRSTVFVYVRDARFRRPMSTLEAGVVGPSFIRYAVTFWPSTVTAKSTQPQPLEITKLSPRSQLPSVV